MKFLVDTHIFLWMLARPEKFNSIRRYELESPANEIFLSAVSVAELMIKHSIGKMNVQFDPIEMAGKLGLTLLDFSGVEAMELGKLPYHHRDPFDRMLIAQAITNDLALMSDDAKINLYQCKVI